MRFLELFEVYLLYNILPGQVPKNIYNSLDSALSFLPQIWTGFLLPKLLFFNPLPVTERQYAKLEHRGLHFYISMNVSN